MNEKYTYSYTVYVLTIRVHIFIIYDFLHMDWIHSHICVYTRHTVSINRHLFQLRVGFHTSLNALIFEFPIFLELSSQLPIYYQVTIDISEPDTLLAGNQQKDAALCVKNLNFLVRCADSPGATKT